MTGVFKFIIIYFQVLEELIKERNFVEHDQRGFAEYCRVRVRLPPLRTKNPPMAVAVVDSGSLSGDSSWEVGLSVLLRTFAPALLC